MRKEKQKDIYTAIGLLLTFALWTALICFVDVQAIGPNNSTVGLAAINRFVHDLTGVHMSLYVITDWLSLVPICFSMGFALFGLGQWIKKKHLLKVDRSILALGVFYVAVIAAYCFFEMFPLNYRPILINGYLEVSYPSSTTMLVLCIMTTAIMQFNARIDNIIIRRYIIFAMTTFMTFMVLCRLLSGVHWFTDIVGSVLLSALLVKAYQIFESV